MFQEDAFAAPLVIPHSNHLNIIFENVSFNYTDGGQIFKDLSMVVEGGKKTAIVGGSGSGYACYFLYCNRIMTIHAILGTNSYIQNQDVDHYI